MAVISKLSVSLTANTKGLQKGLKRAKRKIKDFSKTASVAGAAGIAAFTGGLALMTRSGLEASDQIGKLSVKLGVSTEALSEYKLVAQLSGVEFNTLTKSFGFMSNQISDATKGIGDGQKALKELNLSAIELNQLKPEEQFELIADKLNGLTNASDKTRLAMDLFGGRGTALLQVMKDGSAGIRAMRDEAKALGLSLGKDQVESAERANDAMTKLTSVYDAVGLSLSSALAKPLENVSNLFLESAKSSSGFKDQISSMVDTSITAFAGFLEGVDAMYKFISGNKYLQAGGIIGYMMFGKLGIGSALAMDWATTKMTENVGKNWEAWNKSEISGSASKIKDYQLGDFNRSNGNASYLEKIKEVQAKYSTEQVNKQTETNSILKQIAETLRESTNVAVAG